MSAVPLEVERRPPAAAPHQSRTLDVVPTRNQRKSRPKSFYALVTVSGLFAILVAQLLLSIVVSDGAYQISALQQEQKELARDQQSLTEELHVLESPQNLAANAEQLGMVTNSSNAYLRLSDGAVLGNPAVAASSGVILLGADGGPLVQNQLLNGVPLTPIDPVSSTTSVSGAPQSPVATGSVPPDDAGLPSPITR